MVIKSSFNKVKMWIRVVFYKGFWYCSNWLEYLSELVHRWARQQDVSLWDQGSESCTLWVCCCSVAQFCPTLCNPMDCSRPGFPVFHHLLEIDQTHVHWVGDAIQPSRPLWSPSLPSLNLSQHQDLFQWVNSSHQMAKTLEFQLHISPSNEYLGLISFRIDWFGLFAVQGNLKSLLWHDSLKASLLQYLAFFYCPALTSVHDYWKNQYLTIWTFVGKIMSLLCNMLSSFAPPPTEQVSFNFMAAVNIKNYFGDQESKSVTVSIVSPFIFHEALGLDVMTFVFWMLNFKPTFSLSSFTFIKRFNSSSFLPLGWCYLYIWGYWYFN